MNIIKLLSEIDRLEFLISHVKYLSLSENEKIIIESELKSMLRIRVLELALLIKDISYLTYI